MEKIYINDGWKFTTNFSDKLLLNELDPDIAGALKDVRIPHTVKEVAYDYFDEGEYQMVSGYRRALFAPSDWKNKKVMLTFEGVAHKATVYLNGEQVTTHMCGYTAFTVDLSNKIKYDTDNILTVKVDSRENLNVPPFGYVIDYMTFGGIYRDVYVEISNENFISDVFPLILLKNSEILNADLISNENVSEEVSGYKVKKTNIETKVSLHVKLSDKLQKDKAVLDAETFVEIKHKLLDKNGLLHSEWSTKDKDLLVESKIKEHTEKINISIKREIENVFLWDTKYPNLYTLITELYIDGDKVDTRKDKIGFRKVGFKSDGFYLNNKKFKLRGLNRHQSYPYVGYAMPKSMQQYDADILKNELGLNAVRTSHYPQSQHFINRCDEIGLLVFTEIPGWQHIGDEEWKNQAVLNTKEMIKQYRNHPSVFLWGVRINESKDDDEFYKKTNEVARKLDPTRATGGVRAHKGSSLLEEVYTYNDFVHSGDNKGCEPKKNVTSHMEKAYLISEYNGHMYPTKAFDAEEHQAGHLMRHVNVLDAVAKEKDIAGSFGWCMFDYNTHKDFGSGDRICYHGVMDMFRNPKMAALIYACQQEKVPVLDISSSMDIGEHPGCNRGKIYIFSNADSVKMYKNGKFIKEYKQKDSPYKHIKNGPILIDDFIGDLIYKNEKGFTKKQADDIKYALNYTALNGYGRYPWKVIKIALKALTIYGMKTSDAVPLFNKYIGDWGGTSTVYKFEAIKNGKVVKTITKEPMKEKHLHTKVSNTKLVEDNSYDVAEVRMEMHDENGNRLSFYNEPVVLKAEGEIEIIGPEITSFRGGMTGTYIKTIGKAGTGKLTISDPNKKWESKEIIFEISKISNN